MSKCVTKIDSYDMISTGSRYPVWRKKGGRVLAAEDQFWMR